ncbi:FHA domain-containing protein [Streptomyces sp. NPDC006270]|uniref:FHA domain-containing protein n=1 Tax=Streptomyces sp. NPDC006270 TaxID=3364741 RepID=UPI0036912E1D
MPTCPNGHQSGSEDWCEVCGHRMATGGAPAGAAPPPPPPAPGYGYPQQDSGDGPPTMQAELCPQCRTPREAMAPFCEECRWNFLTNTATSYTPLAPQHSTPGGPPPGLNLPPGFQAQGPGGQSGPGAQPGPGGNGGQSGPGAPGGPPGAPRPRDPFDYQGSRPSQMNRPAEPLAPERNDPHGNGGPGGNGGQGGPPPQSFRQGPPPPPSFQQQGSPQQQSAPSPFEPQRSAPSPFEPQQSSPFAPPQQQSAPPAPPPSTGHTDGGDDWMLPPPSQAQPPQPPQRFQQPAPHQGQEQDQDQGPEQGRRPEQERGQGQGYDQGRPHGGVPGQDRPQQPSSWTAVIAPDRAYFLAMMQRSGPEATGLNLPAYSPEQRLALTGGQITIGRRRHSTGESPDVDLSVPPEDPGVSHQHAVLVRQPDGSWAVVDQNSTNGTTLNGAEDPIQPYVPVQLQDGDQVHVGAWTTITLRRD